MPTASSRRPRRRAVPAGTARDRRAGSVGAQLGRGGCARGSGELGTCKPGDWARAEVGIAVVKHVVDEGVAHRLRHQVSVLAALQARGGQVEAAQDVQRLVADGIAGRGVADAAVPRSCFDSDLRLVGGEVVGREDAAAYLRLSFDRLGDPAAVEACGSVAADLAQSLGES